MLISFTLSTKVKLAPTTFLNKKVASGGQPYFISWTLISNSVANISTTYERGDEVLTAVSYGGSATGQYNMIKNEKVDAIQTNSAIIYFN